MKFKEEVIARILEGIRKGLPIKLAASLSGVHYATMRSWIKDAEKGEDPAKVDFLRRYKQAESECAEKCVDIIQKAGIKHWQAAAWLLERRYPEYFGLRKAAELVAPTDDTDDEQDSGWEAYPDEVKPPAAQAKKKK